MPQVVIHALERRVLMSVAGPGDDVTPPTADIVDVAPDPRATPVDSVTIVFSEPVTGFDPGDLRLNPLGSGANLFTGAETLATGDGGLTWTLGNLSAATNRRAGFLLSLAASGSGIRDAAGNGMVQSATESWSNTNEPPLVVSLGPVSPDPRREPVDFIDVVFNEPVEGFDIADLTLRRDGGENLLTGAPTLTALAGGTSFRLGNLAPLTAASGVYTLALGPAGSGVTDALGAPLFLGASDTWTMDVTPPTVDITDVDPDPRRQPVSTIDIVFSERVGGFDKTDLTLTRNGVALPLNAASLSLRGDVERRTWVLSNIGPLTGPDGTYVLTVNAGGAGGVTDLLGNALAAGAAEQWVNDPNRPSGDIGDVDPDPRTAPVESVIIFFNEPVTGFDLSDLTLTRDGGQNLLGAANTLTTTDGGRRWVLTGLAPLTAAEGTYLLTLAADPASGITDLQGNVLEFGATEQWVNDAATLRADIVDVAPDPRSTPVDSIVIVFTEPVTGFDLSDLILTARKGGGANLITPDLTLTSADGVTWTLGNLAPVTHPMGGAYLLYLKSGDAADIRDADGNLLNESPSEEWSAVAVFARHAFYNNSAFDRRKAAADADDDLAVATDKAALLPGETAGFANYTTFASGLNGVMVDVAGIPDALVGAPDAGDLVFEVADAPGATEWAAAPAPASVTFRRPALSGGADRITITWPDGAIQNQWLRVTVKAGGVMGLPAADVFHFGNLIGDTGGGAATATVNALDLAAVRRALNTVADISSRFDFDRSGRVNALDLAAVKAHLNRGLSLEALAPTAAGAPGVASFGAVPITPVAALPARRAWDELNAGGAIV